MRDIDEINFMSNEDLDGFLDGICPLCGGEMDWCDICQQYSSTCCEEYGTCECS